jgi:hypothetical protein
MMNIYKKDLKDFVDEPYFSRGEEYVIERRVKIGLISDKWVKGKIVGSTVYSVKLEYDKNSLTGTCSCPAFYDFGPCKHLAALGLAVIAYNNGKYLGLVEHCKENVSDFEAIEKSLKHKKKDELIDIIIQINSLYPDILYDVIGMEDME